MQKQDPVAYRPRRTPAQNEADWTPAGWTPFGARPSRQEGALVHNEWQRLVAIFPGSDAANVVHLEPHAAQHLWHRALTFLDEEGVLEHHFTWQSLKYHEFVYLLSARDIFDIEDKAGSGDLLSFTDGQTERLRELYEFREDAAVEEYLEEHPSLSNVLTQAHHRIREYFGSNVHLVLDLVKGFEADDDKRLFVFIQTAFSVDEALDTLDKFYEEWWLAALSMVRPKFSIDVEYVWRCMPRSSIGQST